MLQLKDFLECFETHHGVFEFTTPHFTEFDSCLLLCLINTVNITIRHFVHFVRSQLGGVVTTAILNSPHLDFKSFKPSQPIPYNSFISSLCPATIELAQIPNPTLIPRTNTLAGNLITPEEKHKNYCGGEIATVALRFPGEEKPISEIINR